MCLCVFLFYHSQYFNSEQAGTVSLQVLKSVWCGMYCGVYWMCNPHPPSPPRVCMLLCVLICLDGLDCRIVFLYAYLFVYLCQHTHTHTLFKNFFPSLSLTHTHTHTVINTHTQTYIRWWCNGFNIFKWNRISAFSFCLLLFLLFLFCSYFCSIFWKKFFPLFFYKQKIKFYLPLLVTRFCSLFLEKRHSHNNI